MGHHLILIPRFSDERSWDTEAEEEAAKKLLVINLQDSRVQRVEMPEFMDFDYYGGYTLLPYKENQMIMFNEDIDLITIESFERIESS